MRLLGPKGPPPTLEILGGAVMIETRAHYDAVISAAARSKAEARLADMESGSAVLAELGYSPEAIPDFTDPHIRAGLAELLYAIELCLYIGTGWTGPETAKGAPAPFNRIYVTGFMRDYKAAFMAALLAPRAEQILEGNGSAPSLNINSAGAQTIAPDAGPKTSPAPEVSPAKTGKNVH